MLRRVLIFLFFLLIVVSLMQCGRRGGTLTGGPKDVDPPVLVKAEPENLTTNFKAKKIRLTFNEFIKLKDVQDQLIVSPPLKYQPEISPQGGTQKYIEIKIKDTLRPNTTYTINFGQSVQDNNEGNSSSFLTYVFSTGDYIDSLKLQGVVKDAFKQKVDPFISVMLYEIDSTYTDSTLYKKLPNYITNTLDSTVIFNLKNIKAGKYALFAIKDEAKNNIFDQNADKIGFLKDTIVLPSDSLQLPVLTLFKEEQNYRAAVPSFAAKNKIIFGYYGSKNETIKITPISTIPDSVKTLIRKEEDKDSINFWFTPYEMDSIVFTVKNESKKIIDTFTVKPRKIDLDSLTITPSHSGSLDFNKDFYLKSSTPILQIDTSKMKMLVKDSLALNFKVTLDTILDKVNYDFEKEENENYILEILPGAITDFFGKTNDTTNFRLNTKRYSEYSNLVINLTGAISYPILLQLTNANGETQFETIVTDEKPIEFTTIKPGEYKLRVIYDANKNGRWDTGSFLNKLQPERVSYYPNKLKLRPNWDENVTFTLQE